MSIRVVAVVFTLWLVGEARVARAQAPPTGGGTVAITAGPTWTHGVGTRSAKTSMNWATNYGFLATKVSVEVYFVTWPNGVRTEQSDGAQAMLSPAQSGNWNNVTVSFPRAGYHCVKVRLTTTKQTQPGSGTVYEDFVTSVDVLIN